jgi:hypothetical protein
MTKAIRIIVLSPSCDRHFNKPGLNQSSVRRVNASVLIERLVEKVARMFMPTDAAGVGVSATVLQRFRIGAREVA